MQNWGERFFCDGLHLTPEGNQCVFQALLDTINTTCPHVKCVVHALRLKPVFTILQQSECLTADVPPVSRCSAFTKFQTPAGLRHCLQSAQLLHAARRSELLPLHYPPWDAIDRENPSSTFSPLKA